MSEDTGQQGSPPAKTGDLPVVALIVMIVLAAAVMLYAMLGAAAFFSGMFLLLTDGLMALMVLLSAGGYGHAVWRFWGPRDSPPLLALATAAALGLWLLSMMVLAAGSLLPGALTMHVWWPVIGVGVALALWHAHRPLGNVRLPARLSGGSLVWVIVAAAAGLWLAGAVLPAGWLGNLSGINPAMPHDWPGNLVLAQADSTQMLARHLQLPREFHDAGHIQALPHNVYSHVPLGTEMLQLLGMCLRGGGHRGMYLARLICGLYAVLAVAATAGGLRDDRFGARAATGLLATAPWVIYLACVPGPELASLCYLTLALLWVRRWMRRPDGRTAAWIGVMLGSALGVGYAAAAMVAAPVLLVMLAGCLRRPQRLGQVALAGALAAAMFTPWLIRNAAATGNPIFPLATGTLGQGHWDYQTARRWRDAHALSPRPPVPVPPDYSPLPRPTRRQRLTAFLLEPALATRVSPHQAPALHTVLGLGVLLVLLGTMFGMFARPRAPGDWDWALLAVLAMQMLMWVALAPTAPARMASVCIGPISLLCAGGLGRLAGVREVRWLRQSPGVGGRWGLAPATLLLLGTLLLNVLSARAYWSADSGAAAVAPAGLSARHFVSRYGREYYAAGAVAKPGRLALLGEHRAFYFPPGSRYAGIFDRPPLAKAFAGSRSGKDLAERLRRAGVTHLYVGWAGIEHRTQTIGWPAGMSKDRLAELLAGWPVVDEIRYAAATRPAKPEAPAAKPSPPGPLIFTLYAVPQPQTPTQTPP